MSEQELLAYNAGESPAFEVVTVPCPVVAGDTLQGRATESLECAASPVTQDERRFGALGMLQRLLGSVPLAHVDDVCDALVFCMELPDCRRHRRSLRRQVSSPRPAERVSHCQ